MSHAPKTHKPPLDEINAHHFTCSSELEAYVKERLVASGYSVPDIWMSEKAEIIEQTDIEFDSGRVSDQQRRALSVMLDRMYRLTR